MINSVSLRENLCKTFCASITVEAVPSGLAIGTAFTDRSGDPISFYVVEDVDGLRIEDDGDYLARLVGSGIPIDQGTRAQILDEILAQGDAFWDKDTYEIKSRTFESDKITSKITKFLSSLIRVRDLEILTRENVKSTFKEDALIALETRFGEIANLSENQSIDKSLSEFPADLIIYPRDKSEAKIGAVYFVTSNEKLSEALLLQMETENLKRKDVRIIALIENSDLTPISKKKFQRAQNRSLSMPIFRDDEDAALSKIARDLSLAPAA
jgi:hypothetical protein